jgi:catechol 2,3-dioxygenase-like lactoylglutathione lyase family enzyme
MCSNMMAAATLPAQNIERAKKFYADKLGMKPDETYPDGSLFYHCRESSFLVYPSQYAGTAKNTALGFQTDNLDREVKELRSKGVKFEEYDMPGLKTINGVATMGNLKAAWFKDTEGNILAINQMN